MKRIVNHILVLAAVLAVWHTILWIRDCPPTPLTSSQWEICNAHARLCKLGEAYGNVRPIEDAISLIRSTDIARNTETADSDILHRLGISDEEFSQYRHADAVAFYKEQLECYQEDDNLHCLYRIMNVVNRPFPLVTAKDLGVTKAYLQAERKRCDTETAQLTFVLWRVYREPVLAHNLTLYMKEYSLHWDQVGAWKDDIPLIRTDASKLD